MTIAGAARPGTTAVTLIGGVAPAPFQFIQGCWVFPDLALLLALPPLPAGPSWSTEIAIPDDPGLLGARLAMQAVVIPSTQLYGMDWSNGVHLTLGR